MRLLHTSDWHLGQTLHQFERSYEHEQFLGWLLDTLVAEQVDALIIAGDVFDNANPAAAAQARFYQFLTEARSRVPGLNIVIAAGNHDSPGRLEAPAPFLALFDATVIGAISRAPGVEGHEAAVDLERLLVPLRNRDGAIKAWCIAMPFLRPSDLPRREEAPNPYVAGIEALYRAAFALAAARREAGQAIVAMGHCHLTGGQVSEESERRIVIGGAEALSASIFDPAIAYVALGHLHLAQKVGQDNTRRYCGSPLPLSFSEINYPHQVLIIDLDGESVRDIRDLRVPRAVEFLRVPNQPAPVAQAIAELEALALPDRLEAEWPYLQVRVQLTQPEPGLRALIEAALAQKPVRLARIETTYARPNPQETATDSALSIDDLSALPPVDFFQRLYQHRFAEDAPVELLAAFSELLNAAPETFDQASEEKIR
jgi:exonuclease SbcD